MTGKPKIAFYWCASCGGCEEAVLDLGEALLDVAAAADIVFWPVALDFKTRDVKALEDGAITASFINGAVRTTEQEEMARLLRRKSRLVIAFGACAQMGGIPGLANLFDRDSILRAAYPESAATVNPEGVLPCGCCKGGETELHLAGLLESVCTLDQVIEVDYYVPGCPPTPNLASDAINSLLAGTLPPRGSVLAPDRALCEECPRRDTRPESLELARIVRPHELMADEDQCLMSQGIICLGPLTRSGCGARCIRGNMPCSGCFGPTSRVRDAGAKAIASLAPLIASNDEAEIDRLMDGIPDPVGSFYRYSLPGSVLGRRRAAPAAEESHAG